MATVVLKTPEGLSLEHEIASVGSRFIAAILDTFVIIGGYVAATLVVLVLLAVDVTGLSGLLAGVIFGGVPLCIAGYHAAFHIVWGGQTPGKRLLGLRVVAADGSPASAGQQLLRSVLWPIDALLPPVPFGLVGLGLIACTPRHQRLGDIVAGTVVIREQREPAAADPYPSKRWATLEHRQLAGHSGLAAHLDAGDHDFLRRLLSRGELDQGERRQLFVRVAEYYRERLDLPAFEDARAFLGELYLFVRDARERRAAG